MHTPLNTILEICQEGASEGIIIFSEHMKLLFMNFTARKYCETLGSHLDTTKRFGPPIPQVLIEDSGS